MKQKSIFGVLNDGEESIVEMQKCREMVRQKCGNVSEDNNILLLI